MYSVLVITHGHMATAMIESARSLAHVCVPADAVDITRDDSVEAATALIREKLEAMLQSGDVIVLTDLQLGTPFNIVVRLTPTYPIKHLTGANMPLLLSLIAPGKPGEDAAGACKRALAAAQAELLDTEGLIRRADA